MGMTDERPRAIKASVRVQRWVLPLGERTVYAVANPAAPIVTEFQLPHVAQVMHLTHVANHQVVIMLKAVIQTRQDATLDQQNYSHLSVSIYR